MTQQEARDRRQHDDTVHAKWMEDSNGDGKEIGFEAVSYQLSRSPCRVSKVVSYVSKDRHQNKMLPFIKVEFNMMKSIGNNSSKLSNNFLRDVCQCQTGC